MSSPIQKILGFLFLAILIVALLLVYRGKVIVPVVYKSDTATTTITNTSGSTTLPQSLTTVMSTSSEMTEAAIKTEDVSTAEVIDIPLQKKVSLASSNPCTTPITYKLGRFDNGFGISQNELIKALSDAAKLWNKALGKDIFIYDETGEITVNLIYDGRQVITKENEYLRLEIANTENAANEVKKEYTLLGQQFTVKKDLYVAKVAAFNERQRVYNDTVADWNAKGGAPKGEYDALMIEKDSLQQISSSLITEQAEINTLLAEINKRITRYNELVKYANSKVAVGNSTAKKKFTEGQYTPQTAQIDIYQFTDTVKLYRVLAHEFGHALGIDHVTNNESIMYSINSASSFELSKQDLDALKTLCEEN